ncbi:unnamed protein product [Brassicogethes aeneus]|uniref:PH domain-containing protein n=1 Tax=Brassicogethes aeneus TaxID=1431903 RepID=A0A9P0BA06_BRAAE|nr:unnamed protein product [Brassicogethes aeneus]
MSKRSREFECVNNPHNLGDVSDEHGERFHQQMKAVERRYHGFWDATMMAGYSSARRGGHVKGARSDRGRTSDGTSAFFGIDESGQGHFCQSREQGRCQMVGRTFGCLPQETQEKCHLSSPPFTSYKRIVVGGRASPSLPQLGRSASPQPPRPRHLSVSGPSPRANFETPPLKEERESPPKDQTDSNRHSWTPERSPGLQIDPLPTPVRNDYLISSGSPPTRDKLRCDDKARARRDWRNERLRDIATALTDRSPESSLALPSEGLLHLKKGWLWVKSDGTYVKRWVVLCGPTLNVYQDQDEHSSPENVIEMASVTSYSEVPTDTKYGFEIVWGGPTITLSAVTQGIRTNWLQALKKAAPIAAESPVSPATPRSLLLSSDEEYRTASEGGRRGSEDWSELPPSPPLSRLTLGKVKDRTRLRPRLPRCQSRQSTLDSTSTDELDSVKAPIDVVESNNTKNSEVVEIQRQLANALGEVQVLEEEIARLKKVQSEAMSREKKSKEDLLATLDRTEKDLNQRNFDAELKFLKEQRSTQRRLSEAEEAVRINEEKCSSLNRELQGKQRVVLNLQEELEIANERLARTRQDNDRLYKKIQEIEGRITYHQNYTVDSLTDLTNIDLDVDLAEMGQDLLKEYCLDLKCRFEKAVIEIRAVKRELREAYEKSDALELDNYGLVNRIEILSTEHQAEVNLLVARLDHLTAKLGTAEKQLRVKSKDKRRSLSLKGRESFSINKEVEDKVTELEAKILSMERGRTRRKYKRDKSNERVSPIDDKALRRLRRKSLDSATSSEPMKLLMRLSTLESKVTNVNASNESLNVLTSSAVDLTKLREESLEEILRKAKVKVEECLRSLSTLKSDKLSPLHDLKDILNVDVQRVGSDEAEVINVSTVSVVKQLQSLLMEKLTALAEKKRLLQESDKLDGKSRLQILAEKIAYENVLVARIQEALVNGSSDEVCSRLITKETRETAHLMINLQSKLNGGLLKQQVSNHGAEYLVKILTKCLINSSRGFKSIKNFTANKNPSLNILREERDKLDAIVKSYKANKLPHLAEALALETMNLAADKTCRLRSLSNETVDILHRTARESVNSELIQSEINHVLLRAAQVYQSNIESDQTFFFSFFAAERAALELWSDSVGECLHSEVNQCLQELTDLYQTSLSKMQKQNFRRRVESERNSKSPSNMLVEFADIIAHKALIDARMNVLTGRHADYFNCEREDCDVTLLLNNDNDWGALEASAPLSGSLRAEFSCMVEGFGEECYALLEGPELEEVCGCLDELADKVRHLQQFANVAVVDGGGDGVGGWRDVCRRCRSLRDDLEGVRSVLARGGSFRRSESLEDQRPVYLGTEYLTQVENLRAAYRCALASCKERHQSTDIEQLRNLCERVLGSMEQWHRRTIQELREAHAHEMQSLRRDKEQALAEETQATLAALDAMRKAHEAEVRREVARFKQEFARQQRDEIVDLKERLSVKSLEAKALEEQLAHAQHHIAQLERNPLLSLMQN